LLVLFWRGFCVFRELNLTADQQAKLKPILEDQQKQIEAVWKEPR
jgi:Spy/CpxP family protein refolding chaperone